MAAITQLAARDSVPAADEVGYLFTEDDDNTAGWLYKGWIDAAATDRETFETLQKATSNRFRIIARSIEVPRQAVILSGTVPDKIADRIHEILTGLEDTARGRNVLMLYDDTARFDPFPDGVEALHALAGQRRTCCRREVAVSPPNRRILRLWLRR